MGYTGIKYYLTQYLRISISMTLMSEKLEQDNNNVMLADSGRLINLVGFN